MDETIFVHLDLSVQGPKHQRMFSFLIHLGRGMLQDCTGSIQGCQGYQNRSYACLRQDHDIR